jgi:hypothetical protein
MVRSGREKLFDADARRWFPGAGLDIFPAPVRPAVLRFLGAGLLLVLVALAAVVLLIVRIV